MSSMPPFPNQLSMSLTRPVTSPTVVPGWDSVEAEPVAERRGLPRHPCRPGAPRDGRRHAGRDAGGATSLLDRAVKFFRAAPPHHRITARSSHQAEHGRQAPVPPDLGRRSTMRNAVLAAGFPESVPATTIDRQCGSSQQAAHFGAQGVIAGAYDVVIAGGVEVMTRTPMGASVVRDLGFPFGPRMM